MILQQLPREILYNICRYLDVKDVVDFQDALPAVSQCGIFSDLKKERGQDRIVRKVSFYTVFFRQKDTFVKK